MQLKQVQQVQVERDAVLLREGKLRQDLAAVKSEHQQDLAAAERRNAAALRDQLAQEATNHQSALEQLRTSMAREHSAAIKALEDARAQDESGWQGKMREARVHHAAEVKALESKVEALEKTAGEHLAAVKSERQQAAASLETRLDDSRRAEASLKAQLDDARRRQKDEAARSKGEVEALQQQLTQAQDARDTLAREVKQAENRHEEQQATAAREHGAAASALKQSLDREIETRLREAERVEGEWQGKMREAQKHHTAEMRELEKTAIEQLQEANKQLEAAKRQHLQAVDTFDALALRQPCAKVLTLGGS